VKLLLVEDDKKIATAVKRGLEAEGYTVEVAFDGQDGLWMATESSYDLIVLDIMLPGRNGYLICADLRDAGDWTPILMLTAKGGDLDEAEALDTGADDYLAKPFRFEELLARLRALIRRSRRMASSEIRCGAITMDSRAATVTRDGQAVKLTALEFRVLAYLMHHRGRVVPQSELTDHIYSVNADRDSNTIEVFVARLRRKLGVGVIETVRGFGYRVAAEEAPR